MPVFESFKVPIAVIGLVMGMGMFTYCSESDKPSSSEKADLVVYGKIFTAEDNELVEAFAVKDGKYVYVGDKAGAAAYVQDGKTEVVDYSGEGLVMPGCGNGHAHYATVASLWEVGTFVGYEDDVDTFLGEIVPAAVGKARETGATLIFGLGWNVMLYPEDLPYRKLLDDLCSDIPIYIADDEGHKALVNSATLVKAGLNDKGYPLKSFFDYGINVSSHSDFPATSDAPDDPFGIMEIAVTGVYQQEPGKPWWPEELLTREQALTALTINVARQMFLENERGSICTGKYADFLLLNQDVFTCPADQIHATEPVATYFEGTKVYPM